MYRVLTLILCYVQIQVSLEVNEPKTFDYTDIYHTRHWIERSVPYPILGSTERGSLGLCRDYEYLCSDGECIGSDHICDGYFDCTDASDEKSCPDISYTPSNHSRTKRQTKCRKNQWQCHSGLCINFDGKCDGVKNCIDGSDETFALCRNSTCHSNWFRCTYGACVDGTATCNGVQDCADNSDELLPRCRNDTNGALGQFTCDDGGMISTSDLCDGVKNCADGSDETLRACADNSCLPYQFQCAYGACNNQNSMCNGVEDCADGSDESAELCRPDEVNNSVDLPGYCTLPPYPAHGTYTVGGDDKARPGDKYKNALLNYTCSPGYGLDVMNDFVLCQDGNWFGGDFPKCVVLCKLNPHHSVDYRCLITGPRGEEGTRICSLYEPLGTVVRTECKKPNYYTPVPLTLMRCQEDGWDTYHTCTPECGRLTPNGTDLIIDGVDAQRGEIPWHVGVYRTNGTYYEQICGGSLITTTVIISAAHCFWKDVEKKLPASHFAVAVGKIYRPWDYSLDKNAQTSEVEEIRIPNKFLGAATNFQDDIAIVIAKTPFRYETHVRPVCLDFDYGFDQRQLKPLNLGKVAGWGLTAINGEPAFRLQVTQFPYVDDDSCFEYVPNNFREFVTSDKFCGGFMNGTTLCKGDSGGGLAFPELVKGVPRYYLRGIVSTAPRDNNKCTKYTFTTFTHILKHEHFIKESL